MLDSPYPKTNSILLESPFNIVAESTVEYLNIQYLNIIQTSYSFTDRLHKLLLVSQCWKDALHPHNNEFKLFHIYTGWLPARL